MRVAPAQAARRAARSAAAAGRVRADCVSAVRYADLAHLGVAADFLHVAGRRHRSPEDCIAAGRRHCSTRLPEEADWNSSRCPVRAIAPARDSEARVMSRCRAHRGSAQRRVLVSRDPLAPDTDLHHRTIRECWVDYRTDGASGRDEKDVGVRSCSCGVAVWLRRKVLLRMAHGDRGANSREIRNPILCWNSALQGCARARMVLSAAANVQQQVEC